MKRSRLKHLFEYYLVRLYSGFCRVIGHGNSLRVARLLGSLAFQVDRKHRRIADENLQHAFGESRSPRERQAIIRAAFQNLVMTATEACILPALAREDRLADLMEFANEEVFLKAQEEGRGAIFVTGHIGNWELASAAPRLLSMPPFTCIARELKNPYVDAWFKRMRSFTGSEYVDKDGALRKTVRVLQDKGFLVFLLDQHAGDKGIPVDFFGRPAYTFDSVAALSRRFDVPVIIAHDWRSEQHPTRHSMRCTQWIEPGDSTVEQLTAEYTRCLEEIIREKPQQWLWMHRRWKTGNLPQEVPEGNVASDRVASQTTPLPT